MERIFAHRHFLFFNKSPYTYIGRTVRMCRRITVDGSVCVSVCLFIFQALDHSERMLALYLVTCHDV